MNKKNKKQKKSYDITFEKKQNKDKHLPLLHVEWFDHAVSGTGSWRAIDDVGVYSLTCFSVGWLVDETKDAIALATNVASNGTVGEIMTILKSCIIKRETL